MLLLVLAGGMALLVCSTLSNTRLKRVRKASLLMPLIAGLLLTTLVHAAEVEALPQQDDSQHQMLMSLEIAGVGLIIFGVCSLLCKVRLTSLWLPNDAPFESYKPFKPLKPAYTSFPVSPIVTPPIFEHSAMTLTEAARYLRISEHDVRMLIDEGSIIATARGNTYTITRRALDDFAYGEKFGI